MPAPDLNPPPSALATRRGTDDRWKFWRDLLVFQLKMLISNVRDFALMPVSLVAALLDLFFKGEREGELFYQVLKWGAHSERVIDVYSAVEKHEATTVNPSYTVVARLESVLVRECEKGGTAASVKAAMDRTFDQIRTRDRALSLVARASDTLRSTLQRDPERKPGPK
jgi:hypothetical protein